MKKMRRIVSALLATTMVMSMGFTALADDDNKTAIVPSTKYEDYDEYLNADVVIPKTYNVNYGTAPAEVFTYTFKFVEYINTSNEEEDLTSAPVIDAVTYNFGAISASATHDIPVTINLDNFEKLGIYKYEVTESNNKTAGVTYADPDGDGTAEKLYLVLTVLRDDTDNQKKYVAAMHYEDETGKKVAEGATFTNTYDAGKLNVTKKIIGNMADMNKRFEFTVTFKSTGTTIKSDLDLTLDEISENYLTKVDDVTALKTAVEALDEGANNVYYTVNGGVGSTEIVYKFYLGNNETATFDNIPAGVTYEVTEVEDGYTKVSEVWSGVENEVENTISKVTTDGEDVDSVVITNQLGVAVDTGISLDNMPYIMVLALVALGLVGFVSKKRSMEF